MQGWGLCRPNWAPTVPVAEAGLLRRWREEGTLLKGKFMSCFWADGMGGRGRLLLLLLLDGLQLKTILIPK